MGWAHNIVMGKQKVSKLNLWVKEKFVAKTPNNFSIFKLFSQFISLSKNT
jgi:hypothetical protein